jgi:hypothetical protein
MDKGDVDGYYVIFPRGACGDSIEVWCFGMGSSSPKEYIDLDPTLNYGVNAGLDAPCQSSVSWTQFGKSWFNKVFNIFFSVLYCLSLSHPEHTILHHTASYIIFLTVP